MLLENSFEVPADIDRVWSYLLDVERVVVCMPGAELTETIDEDNYKGRVKIKLGPVSLSFAGTVAVAERDNEAHRVVLKGSGMEQRGKGRASVTVTATAEQSAGGTRIDVVQDLQVQGQVASMSRGMMGDVSAKLTQQFASCIQANLGTEEVEAAGPPAATEEATLAASNAPATATTNVPATPGADAPPATSSAPAASAPPARGGELSAPSLLLVALKGAVKRLIARLTGRSRTPS
jgi:uncharacterized protein